MLWGLVLLIALLCLSLGAIDKLGQFGDAFGIANALFTGLALLGAVYAILLQSEGLTYQREELRLTREEMALQREELRLAREEAALQSKVFKEQLEVQRQELLAASEPVFSVSSVERDTFTRTLYLDIGGAPVSDIHPQIEPPCPGYSVHIHYGSRMDKQFFCFRKDPSIPGCDPGSAYKDLTVTVSYVDRSGSRRSKNYLLVSDGSRLTSVIKFIESSSPNQAL